MKKNSWLLMVFGLEFPVTSKHNFNFFHNCACLCSSARQCTVLTSRPKHYSMLSSMPDSMVGFLHQQKQSQQTSWHLHIELYNQDPFVIGPLVICTGSTITFSRSDTLAFQFRSYSPDTATITGKFCIWKWFHIHKIGSAQYRMVGKQLFQDLRCTAGMQSVAWLVYQLGC